MRNCPARFRKLGSSEQCAVFASECASKGGDLLADIESQLSLRSLHLGRNLLASIDNARGSRHPVWIL